VTLELACEEVSVSHCSVHGKAPRIVTDGHIRRNIRVSRTRLELGRHVRHEEVQIMADARSLGGYRAPSIVTAFNPLVRRMLRAGLPLGPNAVLTVRGRSTGLPRTFPVAIIEVDDRRFIQSPYGEVNWVRNLRVNPEAVLAKGTREEPVEAVEVNPEDAVAILRAGLKRYLSSRLLSPIARVFTGIRRDSTSEEILAQARRRPMFELRPRDSGERPAA
jgi:deazaflavin-dependent oxidoreductase (nitroreductase family)